MNIVYTDMTLGALCALEFLGRKYAQRAEDFTVVATDYGVCETKSKCAMAVRKVFPNCHFCVLGDWDVLSVGSVKRIYCMSHFAPVAADLAKLPTCNQIYVLGGTSAGKDGYVGDPRAEADVDAYEYVLNSIVGYGMHITHEEVKLRFDVLRFSGIAKLSCFEKFQAECGAFCPELQFMLVVESMQGFMFHVFANTNFAVYDSTFKVLMQERNHRYDDHYRFYNQYYSVKRGICGALHDVVSHSHYNSKTLVRKLYFNVALFLFMYTEGLSMDRRIFLAQSLLNNWKLQCFTPYVTWLFEHAELFMYMPKDHDEDDMQIAVWKCMNCVDASVPKFMLGCLAEYCVTGDCHKYGNARGIKSSDCAKWETRIHKDPNFNKDMLEDVFLLLTMELCCCDDVVRNGKLIFSRGIAYDRLMQLKRHADKGLRDLDVSTKKSNVFA